MVSHFLLLQAGERATTLGWLVIGHFEGIESGRSNIASVRVLYFYMLFPSWQSDS